MPGKEYCYCCLLFVLEIYHSRRGRGRGLSRSHGDILHKQRRNVSEQEEGERRRRRKKKKEEKQINQHLLSLTILATDFVERIGKSKRKKMPSLRLEGLFNMLWNKKEAEPGVTVSTLHEIDPG